MHFYPFSQACTTLLFFKKISIVCYIVKEFLNEITFKNTRKGKKNEKEGKEGSMSP